MMRADMTLPFRLSMRRLTAFCLTLTLLLGPVVPAFAQEEPTSAVPIVDRPISSDTDEDDVNSQAIDGTSVSAPTITKTGDPEDAADNEENPDITNQSGMAVAEDSGAFQPAGQSTARQIIPEPDPTTGALIYSYPLTVPPGRNGLTPGLKLTYNSQDSQRYGYLGDRWSLNIPSIERLNKTGTDRLYTDNYLSSSLSGELVPVSGTAYAPKVENGDFLKYAYDGASWTVTDKTGTVYKFGAEAASRQDDPSNAAKVYRWMLSEVRDTNNNFIAYSYYKDGGQIYPDTITYTGNGSTNGMFKITFGRGDYDSASPTLYYPSFKVKTGYRITSITASVNDEWVRKYDLGYRTGDQGYRPLLASIVESGRNVETSTVTTLPAATFSYKLHGTMGWNQASTWQLPEVFVNKTEIKMLQIQDLNGDTFPDVAYADEGGPVEKVYISNTLDGWNGDDGNWTFPTWLKNVAGYRDNGARIFDVNGDLLNDVVRSLSAHRGEPAIASHVYLNSGNAATGWTETSSIGVPTGFVFGEGLNADSTLRVFDVNGDGLADLILADIDDDRVPALMENVYLGTGSGWVEAPSGTWEVPFPFRADTPPHGAEVYTFAQVADVNGDNLPDILWRYSESRYWWPSRDISAEYTFINNGHGWEPNDPELRRVPMPFAEEEYSSIGRTDLGVRSTDLNGDGISDILHSIATSRTLDSYGYLNSGREVTFPYTSLNPANAPEAIADSGLSTNPSVQLADVNADGLDDFVYAERRRTDYVTVKRTSLAKPNSFTDLLTTVTLPSGGRYAITYKLSNQYRNPDNSLLNPHLPLVIPTVQQITATDPVRNVTGTSTWSYRDGSYYYASPTDRRFAGFGLITKTDPAGNVTKTYYHQGNASDAGQGEYADDASKIGKPYRIEQYDGAGNLYAATVQKWDRYSLGTGRDFVKLASATTLTYDGNGTHRDTAREFVYDNSYGNLAQRTDWGEVTASSDGSFVDKGSDKSTENISYVANTSNYVVGLTYQDVILDQGSNRVRETKTYYDGLALGLAGGGNPTRTEEWVAGTTYVASQKGYDANGMVVSATDPRGKVISYAYDSYGLYPATVTDPLAHVTQYLYDYASGRAKQTTDQNGFIYQTSYDGLGRVLTEKQPDRATPTTLVTKIAYGYTDSSGNVKMRRTDYLSGSTAADLYQYFDGFGRLVQERKEAEIAGAFNVKDTVYNGLGLKQKESLPYAGSGASRTTATTTVSLYSNYSYDPLGRPLSVGDAVGTTTYAYDDWKTTVTDANGKVKRYYKDAFGNLVRVDEVNGGSTYATNYAWSLVGKLVKITDALGNARSFTYDGLGRRLTAQDLHAPADASYGTWTYVYDDAGNVVRTVSPNALTTNYTYNDINQVLTEDYTGAAGTEIAYTYGGCAKGVGKLCSVTMTSGANSAYTYDPIGDVASETKTINGAAYKTSYSYDRLGNLLVLTYPDSAQARYTFNTAGLLEKIERKESGGVFENVVSNFDYGPTEQVTVQANANGTSTTKTYDAARLYRLTNILTVSPGAGGGEPPATTSTFYPDPGSSGPTGGATVERSTPISGEAWSTLRAGAGAYVSSIDNPNNLAGTQSGTATNQWRAMDRAVFTFDTSAISDTDIIRSATLSIHGSAKSDDGTAIAPDINIYDAVPLTDYNFAAANYGQIGTTAQSTALPYAGWSTTGYNDFALNAAGLGNISKSGITRFGTRNANYDVANVAPAWSANTGHFITGYLAQEAGTSKDPKLVVIHAPAPPPAVKIQDVSFTYDAVGNITQLVDSSGTSSAKTVTYAYDDLHRLISAAATGSANSSDYTQAFAYDALGNITSGPAGTYLYQGNTGTLTANPHAATSVNGVTHTYDRDGNLTGNGTLTHAWNYRDQLAWTISGSTTVYYYYDHNGDRVHYLNGATGIVYPNKHYSAGGGKKTKQIYAGGQLVATVETVSAVVTPYYVHTDQLGSTTSVSDGTGTLVQTLDYYPFGAQRITSGTHNEQRQYIGQIYDTDTGLDYLNARYFAGGLGKFISEDSVFLSLGDEKQVQLIVGMGIGGVLSDPQVLNSYSYARNNPIIRKDPQGTCPVCVVALSYLVLNAPSITGFIQSLATPVGQFSVSQAIDDAKKGRYGWAFLGAVTAGEFPGEGAALLPKANAGLSIGQDLGKLGTIIENTAGEIAGFSRLYAKDQFHGLDQAITRGVNSRLLLDTVKNPLITLRQSGGNTLRLTEKAGVVLDRAGQVVTAYTSKQFLPHIKELLGRIKE